MNGNGQSLINGSFHGTIINVEVSLATFDYWRVDVLVIGEHILFF